MKIIAFLLSVLFMVSFIVACLQDTAQAHGNLEATATTAINIESKLVTSWMYLLYPYQIALLILVLFTAVLAVF